MIIDDDDMAEEESKRRLDDLRDRLNLSARGRRDRLMAADQKLVGLRRICYFVAVIVFVVTSIASDFAKYPIEASIFGLFCATVAFFIASLVVWAIRRFWTRRLADLEAFIHKL